MILALDVNKRMDFAILHGLMIWYLTPMRCFHGPSFHKSTLRRCSVRRRSTSAGLAFLVSVTKGGPYRAC
jgi:hypothetical protein